MLFFNVHCPSIELTAQISARPSTGPAPDVFDHLLPSVFETSCGKCHGQGPDSKANVDLRKFRSVSDLIVDLELLEQLIEVLDAESMPPEGEPELPPESRQQMLVELRRMFDIAVSSGQPVPQTPIRRMNRFQYNNAVQDLFQLKPVVFPLRNECFAIMVISIQQRKDAG